MNVLYLSPVMAIGGEELSTLSLAREMLKRGHNVFVRGNQGPMSQEFIDAGATFIPPTKPFRRNLFGIVRDLKDIRRINKENRIEIIHSQSVFPTISASFAMLGMVEKPSLIFHQRGVGARSYYFLPHILNYLVDCVICNSDHEMNVLRKFGLNVRNMRIHNCMNLSGGDFLECDIKAEFGIQEDTKVLGVIGRLTPEKGHTVLLEAFEKVVRILRDVSVVLLIVGDGPLRNGIEKMVTELKLENHVIFTGFRRDMENVYRALDLLVVPSLFETFGNVVVEASRFGVPVVASSVGGLPETVFHGKSGLLFPPGDVESLANTILRLIKEPGLLQKLGLAGEQLSEHYFSSKRLGDEVESLYINLAQSRIKCNTPMI